MKTKILNKTWKVKDLQLIASTKVVKDLVAEYKKDPNCRPYDFVASEKISDLEKASFINAVLNKNLGFNTESNVKNNIEVSKANTHIEYGNEVEIREIINVPMGVILSGTYKNNCILS